MLVALILSLLVGTSLGLLGGGGSILTIPILKYVLGMDARAAIALSLLVVGTTSAAGLVQHARRGNVKWRIGILFGAAGMIGAYGGGRVAKHVPSAILLIAFNVMMFVTATAMLRPKRKTTADEGRPNCQPSESRRELPLFKIAGQGLLVGTGTGLVGAGGGFLVVPALVVLGGLPMEIAIGTSLQVIAMQSLSGFLGFLGHTSIDWNLGLAITAAAIVGSMAGGLLSCRVSRAALRKGFGWFMVAMALFILAQELPALLGHRNSPLIALLVSAGGTLLTFIAANAENTRMKSRQASAVADLGHEGRACTTSARVVPASGTGRVSQLGGKAS